MNDIHILCISDIHFNKRSPENQEMVIRSFFKDLPDVICKYDRDSLYCIISGDLVKAGNMEMMYNEFHDNFIKKLSKYIYLNHIICTPGNHDLNRNILEKEDWASRQNELVESKEDEETYNETLKVEKDSVILKKFEHFDNYCKRKLLINNYDLFGYSTNFVPDISVYCLNSALLSNGGQEGFPDDIRRLRIDTSGVYEWAYENEGRTKVLVLHHPLDQLTEYAERRIENLIRNEKIDVVVTGHLHRQDFKKYLGKEGNTTKYCSSPQLFSNKRDENGYSILHFSGKEPVSVEYRKWSTINDVFIPGSEFSMTPDGIIPFKKSLFTRDDIVSKELNDELTKRLRLYNYTPAWVDRIISNVAPGTSAPEGEIIVWDHIDIINSDNNIQIVAGAQFGLTCFAHKLILEAWNIKKEHWLYLDATDLRLSKIETSVDDFMAKRDIVNTAVRRIVIDNWNRIREDRVKIIKKIKKLLPEAKMVFLNNEDDSRFFRGLNSENYETDFSVLYLRELSRTSIRKITREFLLKWNLSEEDDDKILERLITELMDLNVHRTPVNCIQILLNFQQNYDAHPANRTKMLKSLIQFFFLKPDSFFYTENIDETDCCIIMGALCEVLMRNNDSRFYQRYFSEDEYYEATEMPDSRYTKNLRGKLLEAMKDAQIIVPYLSYYEFRFNYWVYFFAAYQMYYSSSFYNYMVDEQKCIYMPDIIEFYTGIEEKSVDLVEKITKRLAQLSKELSDSLGVMKNPYNLLKYRANPYIENSTRDQMKQSILGSKLPNDIKDAVLEEKDDNTRPFIQTIERVMDQYKVRNMMSLCRSASRALRNSNLISPELRSELFQSIEQSWLALIKVLQILSNALAQTGHGGMGGAKFTLVGEFPKEPEKRHISVLTSIPFNVVMWYRNDIYSAKRVSVYKDTIMKQGIDEVSRHMSVLLIAVSRPEGWHHIVSNYIDSVGRNSFYLGDLNNMLSYCYQVEYMDTTDQKRTTNLLLECWEKARRTTIDPNVNRYFPTQKKDDSHKIPKREV